MRQRWLRMQAILSVLSLVVAIAAFATPEIRQWIGLEPPYPVALQQTPEAAPADPRPLEMPASPQAIAPPAAVGIEYTQLDSLLTAKNWRAADQATRLLMVQIANREQDGWINDKSLAMFPCDDLRAIDQRWLVASNGQFGFSVQHRLWQAVGGDLEQLSDRVGWRQNGTWLPYDSLTFNLQAPIGHLPSGDGLGLWLDGMRVGRGYPLLVPALVRCGL